MQLFEQLIEFLFPLLIFLAITVGPRIAEAWQRRQLQEEDRKRPGETEEQRRAREEVRRIILENQAKEASEQSRPTATPAPTPAQRRQTVDAGQRREMGGPLTAPTAPGSLQRPARADTTPTATFDHDWHASRRIQETQDQMREMERLTQASQKRLQEVQRQTRSAFENRQQSAFTLKVPKRTSLSSGLRRTVRNPQQLRQAIVLSEILAKPISMRQDQGSDHPVR